MTETFASPCPVAVISFDGNGKLDVDSAPAAVTVNGNVVEQVEGAVRKHSHHKSSSSGHHHHKHHSKDKEKSSLSSSATHKSHHHHSSSSHKSHSKDKERTKDKDKNKERSSSSSHHHSHHHKSAASSAEHPHDKHEDSKVKPHALSSSSGHKDKDNKERHSKHHEKDKEKDKQHSSKDSNKHHHHRSSSSSHHHKDGTSTKHKSSSGSNSKTSNSHSKNPSNSTAISEPITEQKPKLKVEEAQEQDEAEVDAVSTTQKDISTASSCDYSLSQFKNDEPCFQDSNAKIKAEEEEDSGQESEEQTTSNNSSTQNNVKSEEQEEESSDEDIPLAIRVQNSPSRKRTFDKDDSDDDEETPLISRKSKKLNDSRRQRDKIKNGKKRQYSSEEEEDIKPVKKVKHDKKVKVADKHSVKVKQEEEESPKKAGRKKKNDEEEQQVWKWWEEEKKDDGKKWSFLEHKGPVFAPEYEPLPDHVKFFYNSKEMKLSMDAEEVATFYAKMLDHDYTTKDVFNVNFFKDWRRTMTEKERSKITDLKKCDFKHMHTYFMDIADKNRNRSKEEKQTIKERNEAIQKEYGFCKIDGHMEKIGNFKIEPPGLFRGRGEHPRMGMLKRRVNAEDVVINCSKDSKRPQPPPGHKWKEVRHDNTVTWLASWTENVQNQVKYVMLNPSSKLKGEKDWQKYETARSLHKSIDKIRREYRDDWKSKEMRIRQRAVALYFIDKLALRAGNEKDEDQADTVGCCSLRFEHITLHESRHGKEYTVVFDFPGKDSIRYYNEVQVEKRVFKNLQLFMENKSAGDDLFDRLNTSILNKHLNELMEGLTAKVFRTYNASWTLQQQLDALTEPDATVAEKILAYNRANRAVAVLCNHQRSVPKGHDKSMEKLKEKIEAKKDAISEAQRQLKDAHRAAKHGSVKEKTAYDKRKKQVQRLKEQLSKLEIQETDRDENKTIALGTSKLNYLDPRISVAWCKKYDVPIEKIYNKTQRDKFRWAIDMAGPDYRF